MVNCIQRKKKNKPSGVHCPVTKKLEALTPPATDHFSQCRTSSVFASNPPPGRRGFFDTAQVLLGKKRKCFKTVPFDEIKTSIWTFEKPAHFYTPRGCGIILCLFLTLPLWT